MVFWYMCRLVRGFLVLGAVRVVSGAVMVDLARLAKICDEGLAAVGYELVDVEYVSEDGGWVLRVYIDRPSLETPPAAAPLPPSAICLADCQTASRHLGTVLDVEDLIPNAYRLEVSSPGIERPLRQERDFLRFAGRAARVQLRESIDGRK